LEQKKTKDKKTEAKTLNKIKTHIKWWDLKKRVKKLLLYNKKYKNRFTINSILIIKLNKTWWNKKIKEVKKNPEKNKNHIIINDRIKKNLKDKKRIKKLKCTIKKMLWAC
jgi:LAS superfamily LD-carboxypeptidase LdcB